MNICFHNLFRWVALDGSGSIQCIFCWQVAHAFGRKTGSDNIVDQILKALIIIGPNGGATIDIKATVSPGEHIFSDSIIDFALSFEHFKHVAAKQLLLASEDAVYMRKGLDRNLCKIDLKNGTETICAIRNSGCFVNVS